MLKVELDESCLSLPLLPVEISILLLSVSRALGLNKDHSSYLFDFFAGLLIGIFSCEEPIVNSLVIRGYMVSVSTTQTLSLSPKQLAAAAAKTLQLCPTLSDPMDRSLPGSSIHGIFQARVLE